MAELLPTNFQDDILNEAMNGRRRYQMISNTDGTVSLVDMTAYDQIGNVFGAKQVNEMAAAINDIQGGGVKIEVVDPMTATEEGYAADAKLTRDAIENAFGPTEIIDTYTLGGTFTYNTVAGQSGSYDVVFATPFIDIPEVTCTIDDATGVTETVSNISETGFTYSWTATEDGGGLTKTVTWNATGNMAFETQYVTESGQEEGLYFSANATSTFLITFEHPFYIVPDVICDVCYITNAGYENTTSLTAKVVEITRGGCTIAVANGSAVAREGTGIIRWTATAPVYKSNLSAYDVKTGIEEIGTLNGSNSYEYQISFDTPFNATPQVICDVVHSDTETSYMVTSEITEITPGGFTVTVTNESPVNRSNGIIRWTATAPKNPVVESDSGSVSNLTISSEETKQQLITFNKSFASPPKMQLVPSNTNITATVIDISESAATVELVCGTVDADVTFDISWAATAVVPAELIS